MEDTPANKTPGEDLNKLDLSALKSFEFGTEWTPATDPKKIPPERPDRGRDRDRGRGRSPGPGKPGGQRRDRRPPRTDRRDGEGQPGDRGREGGPRRRGPGGGRDEFKGGSRGDRRENRRGGGRPGREAANRGKSFGPPRPYVSPIFDVTFYPDDAVFEALVKGMRSSCRTYELFEIARLILEKPERCVVVIKAKPRADGTPGSFFVSVPDGVPFETEDEAINHVLENHLSKFFSTESVETEPPKGVFNFVNKCPITGVLLGPPNYHRYPQILQQHYATHNIRMPFDRYKASIEVVKDPEAVAKWLESMKTVTRYTFLGESDEEKKTFDTLEDARVHLLHTCRDRVVRATDATRVPAKNIVAAEHSEARRAMRGVVEMQRRFPLDTANALRGRLRRENFHLFKRGSKGVTYVCAVRRKFRQPGQTFSGSVGKLLEYLDAHPFVQVSQLAEDLLGFAPPHGPVPTPAAAAPVEAKPEVKSEPEAVASETSEPDAEGEPAAQAEEAPAAAEESSQPAEEKPEEPAADASPATAPEAAEQPPASAPEKKPSEPGTAEPAKPEAEQLTDEQKAQLNRLALDLRWLVAEGYVAEFSDGRLFAHPVMEPEGPGKKAKAKAEARTPVPEPTIVEESAEPEPAEPAAKTAAAPVPEAEKAPEPTATEAQESDVPKADEPARTAVDETPAPTEATAPAPAEPEAGETDVGQEPAATQTAEGDAPALEAEATQPAETEPTPTEPDKPKPAGPPDAQ